MDRTKTTKQRYIRNPSFKRLTSCLVKSTNNVQTLPIAGQDHTAFRAHILPLRLNTYPRQIQANNQHIRPLMRRQINPKRPHPPSADDIHNHETQSTRWVAKQMRPIRLQNYIPTETIILRMTPDLPVNVTSAIKSGKLGVVPK